MLQVVNHGGVVDWCVLSPDWFQHAHGCSVISIPLESLTKQLHSANLVLTFDIIPTGETSTQQQQKKGDE